MYQEMINYVKTNNQFDVATMGNVSNVGLMARKAEEYGSHDKTFEIAAKAAFREGIPQAGARLLEPLMKVEVTTPEEYMGDIIGDLNSRRGHVQGMETRGNAQIVTASVPLAEIFGYVNTLRSMSQGRAQYSMEFQNYAPVPQQVVDTILSEPGG